MRVILQRVQYCKVLIGGRTHSAIESGLLALVGFEPEDVEEDLEWMVKKIVNMRIFQDADDRMNLNVLDFDGSLMIVSQFTLHASTKKGNRPSFIRAAHPDVAIPLYERFIELCKKHLTCQSGEFGANMQIELCNDGPVTIMLDSKQKDL